jgi:hypothetical protein
MNHRGVYGMRRPISWIVFCAALTFLLVHSAATDPKFDVSVEPAAPVSIDLAAPEAGGNPEFGYVRTDGTFVPLAGEAVTSASPSSQ